MTIKKTALAAALTAMSYLSAPPAHAEETIKVGVIAAYNGMAAIYEVARKLNGTIDSDKAMAVLRGMKLNSPRSGGEWPAITP